MHQSRSGASRWPDPFPRFVRGAVGVALALCVAVACGGAQTSSSSGPGSASAAWRELTSEHFIVWTNTSPAKARVLIRTIENLRQIVVGVSFFRKDVKGKSFVIAFNDLEEVHQYVAPQFIAQAWSGSNVLLQPVIVVAAASLDDDRRVVTHELTHVIAFNAIRNQPRWFAEGIAGYFETVRLDEERATIDVGRPLDDKMRVLHESGPTPISTLFACSEPACMDDRFYATTWALFTYLLNEHPAHLMKYMQRLLETSADEQAQVWTSVFPELPPSKLDHELATWLHYGKVRISQYTIALKEWPVNERPIGEADVLAAKGVLRFLYAPKSGAPKEITNALALDSTNVMANMINAAAQKSVTPEIAQSVTSAHPDDWRAWWLAWRAAQNATDSNEAREKTCTLLEANPGAVPIEACARDGKGGFVEDPRQQVFMAATPRIYPCLAKSKAAEIATTITIDIDIADSGAVLAARIAMGSPDTNACVEEIVKGLTFPPHHGGTYHMNSTRPAAH